MAISEGLIEALCVGSSEFARRIWPCFSQAVITPYTFGSIPLCDLTAELRRRVTNDMASNSETLRFVMCHLNGSESTHEEVRAALDAYTGVHFLLCSHDVRPPLLPRASYCCLNGEDHAVAAAIHTMVSSQISGPRYTSRT